jgi:hypothetical protein
MRIALGTRGVRIALSTRGMRIALSTRGMQIPAASLCGGGVDTLVTLSVLE